MRIPWIRRSLACVALIAMVGAAQAADKKFPFKNDTGEEANDLHIEFDQGVTPEKENGSYGAFDNYNSSPGSSSAEFDGGTVADGSTTKIRFNNTGPKITIKKWWWTKDGKRIGKIHKSMSCAAISFDQSLLRSGEILTMSAEAVGGEDTGGELLISSWVTLPDASDVWLAPISISVSPGESCTQQLFGLSSAGLESGEYTVHYVAEDLETGLVTDGSSSLEIGSACVTTPGYPEPADGIGTLPR